MQKYIDPKLVGGKTLDKVDFSGQTTGNHVETVALLTRKDT